MAADGTLGKGKVFYDATSEVGKMPGLPDGLSVDSQGNLWASGPGGIWIFNKEAKLLGRINTGERTKQLRVWRRWYYFVCNSRQLPLQNINQSKRPLGTSVAVASSRNCTLRHPSVAVASSRSASLIPCPWLWLWLPAAAHPNHLSIASLPLAKYAD